MSKIKLTISDSEVEVINKLSSNESLNQQALMLINSGNIPSIELVTVIPKNRYRLRVAISNKMMLSDYLNSIINKQAFIDLVSQMATVVKTVQEKLGDLRNLCLDLDCIFIDLRTKQLSLIYWPIINPENNINIVGFFRQLPHLMTFNNFEDTSYVQSYINFFRINPNFSLQQLLDMIHQLSQNTQNFKQQTAISQQNSQQVGIDVQKQVPELNPRESLLNGSDKHAIPQRPPLPKRQDLKDEQSDFNITGKGKLDKEIIEPIDQEEQGTTVLDDDYEEGTVVLLEEDDVKPIAIIKRIKTEEEVEIYKEAFRIGTKRGICDYEVEDNNAVSRNHADIIYRSNQFYVYDNHSTNKSYINGKAIPPFKEIEINDGDTIRLANEDFLFKIM